MSDAPRKLRAPMRSALMAGALAAVVAALVSLPLRSPHDGLLNTGSVTTGTLVLALAGGYLWRALAVAGAGEARQRALLFAAAMGAGFLAWTGLAFAAETQLTRMVSFTVPLAAIAFGGVALLTPLLAPVASRRWVALAALVAAVAVGAALAGAGDAESGRLELPPRAAG